MATENDSSRAQRGGSQGWRAPLKREEGTGAVIWDGTPEQLVQAGAIAKDELDRWLALPGKKGTARPPVKMASGNDGRISRCGYRLHVQELLPAEERKRREEHAAQERQKKERADVCERLRREYESLGDRINPVDAMELARFGWERTAHLKVGDRVLYWDDDEHLEVEVLQGYRLYNVDGVAERPGYRVRRVGDTESAGAFAPAWRLLTADHKDTHVRAV